MSVPPIPPPMEHLGQRPFSFYPPILNIEHNEWMFRRATWSEILVVNTKTELEVWVPRRFLGEISRIDEPVMILGLLKELEYKAGSVWPSERRVIEMPRAVNEGPRPVVPGETPPEPAPAARVMNIRLDSGERRSVRLILGILVFGIVACIVAVAFFREGSDKRISYKPLVQSVMGLDYQDDYFAVVRRLGQPGADRWLSDSGEMQFRVLSYPQHSVHIVLMGSDRNQARYIGAVDKDGKPVDSVQFSRGTDTLAMVRRVGELIAKSK